MKAYNLKLTLIVSVVALMAIGCSKNPPSDKSMEENFHAHRAEFGKLISMLREDAGIETLSERGVNPPTESDANLAVPPRAPKTEISAQRLDEYRRLLRKTGVRIVTRNRDGFVLAVWEDGTSFYDLYIDPAKYRSKDYIFTEEPPTSLVDSLEDPAKLQKDEYSASGYRKIADNWYLRYITELPAN